MSEPGTQKNSESGGLLPTTILAMRDQYRERTEQSLLDAAAAAFSLNSILTADAIDYDAVTPQMREAFSLAFPNDVLEDRLSALDVHDVRGLAGFMSNWRGKYFEVIVRDELNAHGQVGDLILQEGQTAVLASDLSQPGWDLQILSDSGVPVTELQLKATDSLEYVRTALERYPDIDIGSTDEIADALADTSIIASGVENADLSYDLSGPLEHALDTPLQDAIEAFSVGLPVLLIAGTEGTMWLMGRSTFSKAVSRSVDRAVKTGTAMAVGSIVALAGAGVLSLPATVATRLAFSRHAVFSNLRNHIHTNIDMLRSIHNTPTQTVATENS